MYAAVPFSRRARASPLRAERQAHGARRQMRTTASMGRVMAHNRRSWVLPYVKFLANKTPSEFANEGCSCCGCRSLVTRSYGYIRSSSVGKPALIHASMHPRLSKLVSDSAHLNQPRPPRSIVHLCKIHGAKLQSHSADRTASVLPSIAHTSGSKTRPCA